MVGTRHNDACPRKLVMVRVFRTKLHGQHHGMLWNISVESVESTGVYCPVETCSQTDAKWLPRHLQQESVRIIHSTTPLSRDPHTFGRTNTTYIKYTPHISSGGGKWNEDLENMYLGNVLTIKQELVDRWDKLPGWHKFYFQYLLHTNEMCHHYIVNWIYEVINFRFNYLEMSALVSSSTAAHVTRLPACAISI